MSVQLEGSRVLLTGASGGIGQAIAAALRERGAHVLASGRRVEELEHAGEPLQCDLSDPEAVAGLAERASRVDVLVANAGVPASGPVTDFEPEQVDRAIDVNLRAPIQLARVLIPAMVERGSGHLVFISSVGGKAGSVGSSVYSATKFGLRGFAISLRDDLHGTGVGVTTVFPGFVSDAGLFADTGVELPRGAGTKTPGQVANGVIRGIERDKAEITVAPLTFRLGAALAGVAPDALLAVQRRMGSHKVAREMSDAQAHKR